jgi:hypothetical protein
MVWIGDAHADLSYSSIKVSKVLSAYPLIDFD